MARRFSGFWSGQVHEALFVAPLKQKEALCLDLGDNDGLQASYGNQAGILMAWGRLDEEALCLELGLRSELGCCYWNLGKLAREQGE